MAIESKYLPSFLLNDKTFKQVYEAEFGETTDYKNAIDDLLNQCFVDTATWGLDYWEEEVGIKLTSSQKLLYNSVLKERWYGERRARIKARIQGYVTFTKAEALKLANTFHKNGKGARFEERNTENRYKVTSDIDELVDFEALIRAFEEVKPAHLKHILGLSIREFHGQVIKYASKVLTKAKFRYRYIFFKDNITKTIIRTGFVGNSNITHNTYSPYLVLNGAWKLDGTEKLDGVNNSGVRLYHNDVLTIREYNNGNLISEEVV